MTAAGTPIPRKSRASTNSTAARRRAPRLVDMSRWPAPPAPPLNATNRRPSPSSTHTRTKSRVVMRGENLPGRAAWNAGGSSPAPRREALDRGRDPAEVARRGGRGSGGGRPPLGQRDDVRRVVLGGDQWLQVAHVDVDRATRLREPLEPAVGHDQRLH